MPKFRNEGKFFCQKKAFFSLGFLVIFFLAFAGINFLKIKFIKLIPSQLSCTNQLEVDNFLMVKNNNLLIINEMDIAQKIKRNFLCIKEITVYKRPQGLEIRVLEREPKILITTILLNKPVQNIFPRDATPSSEEAKLDFSIQDSSKTGKFVLDDGGFVLKDSVDEFLYLPNIYLVGDKLNLGSQLDSKNFANMLQIISGLAKFNLLVNHTKLEGELLLFNGETNLVFSLNKDPNYQLTSLQLILEQAKMNSKQVEFIDLSFSKPVIIYSSKK